MAMIPVARFLMRLKFGVNDARLATRLTDTGFEGRDGQWWEKQVYRFQQAKLWVPAQYANYKLSLPNDFVPLQQQINAQNALEFLTWPRLQGIENHIQDGIDWVEYINQGIIIFLNGDGEESNVRCWEHVIGRTKMSQLKTDRIYKDRIPVLQEGGMLLQDAAELCRLCKVGKKDMFVLQNDDGYSFAFEILKFYPPGSCKEEPNDQYGMMRVHAIPVDLE